MDHAADRLSRLSAKLTLLACLWAQPVMLGAQPANPQLEQIQRELNLNAVQVESVRQAMEQSHARQEQDKAALEAQIEALLTPLQKQVLDDSRQRGAPRSVNSLILTPEQRQQIRALQDAQFERSMQARRAFQQRVRALLNPEQQRLLDSKTSGF